MATVDRTTKPTGKLDATKVNNPVHIPKPEPAPIKSCANSPEYQAALAIYKEGGPESHEAKRTMRRLEAEG